MDFFEVTGCDMNAFDQFDPQVSPRSCNGISRRFNAGPVAATGHPLSVLDEALIGMLIPLDYCF